MTLNRMSALWARTALLWFVATMAFGMYLGMTKQFGMSSPHAHMGLLGWVSSALFAFLWSFAGKDDVPRPAPLHWAVHNLGVATMVAGLYITLSGRDMSGMIAGGGLVVLLATLWLAAMLWPRLRVR
ncbi:MAG TPA: hypothetical protein VF552_13105 [Allosphingosinicella sp.]|jgi:hypothetical protein